jgi:hypothetical protein
MQQCVALAATALLAALFTYAFTASRAQTKWRALEHAYVTLMNWYTSLWAEVQALRQARADEQRLRADLIKWIEIECRRGGKEGASVEAAVKQRLDERLQAMRELQAQRQHLLQQHLAPPQPPSPPPPAPSPPGKKDRGSA